MTHKRSSLPSGPAAARATRQSRRRQEALRLLGSLDCLRGVPPGELGRIVDLCVFRTFQAGATVLGRQRHDQFLFLVLRGTLQLHLHDKDGRTVLMGILARGDCCGEGPLFGEFFRHMHALAQSDCQLLQLPIAELKTSLNGLPMLTTALRQVYKRRMVESTLARVPLLGQLLPMERLALANLLQPAQVARGELIMRQGDGADALYLIESGQAAIEQYGQTLATLGEGDFFGEIALLNGGPHRADVRALTPVSLLALPGQDFQRLIEQRPDLEQQLRVLVEQRIQRNAAMRSDENRTRELELAVTHGLLRGTHLLVRNPELCPPGCRLCEQSCAERHGQTRLHLDGTMIDRLDVLDACRQCSVGAECVEVCPEDAFERAENGTLLISERCTGCGKCLPACPYAALTRVALPSLARQAGPFWTALQIATERFRRMQAIPLTSNHPTHRADKCDLCHGFADRVCISRCPTGTLRLVPVEEIFPL